MKKTLYYHEIHDQFLGKTLIGSVDYIPGRSRRDQCRAVQRAKRNLNKRVRHLTKQKLNKIVQEL